MIRTIKHLAYELRVREADLIYVIENIDNFYYKKEEVKTKDGFPQEKNGIIQKRTLYPSTLKLKDIQRRINKNVLSQITIPGYAYGSVTGRDNIANAKRHLINSYFFTTDLRKFFPSITNKMVFEMFRSFHFSPTVSRRLTQLVTYKGGVPQGAPTSPTIANLVFIKTGIELLNFASANDLTFTTYLDDITFSSLNDFKNISQFIIQTLKKDGYKISHDKTNYRRSNIAITGISLKNRRLGLTEKYKRKLSMTESFSPSQMKAYHFYTQRVEDANDK